MQMPREKRLDPGPGRSYFSADFQGPPAMSKPMPAPAETSAGTFRRAALVLADGTVFEGQAFGADAQGVGEVCFNTAMTGYQEILSDPSYAGQIVAFTFPHIGIVG